MSGAERVKETVVSEKEPTGAGFEVHIDGDAKAFVLWARNAEELKVVKEVAESFKGVGL